MNQTDIAALHHFYSKHLDIPSNVALAELFAQVRNFTMFFRYLRGVCGTALLTLTSGIFLITLHTSTLQVYCDDKLNGILIGFVHVIVNTLC